MVTPYINQYKNLYTSQHNKLIMEYEKQLDAQMAELDMHFSMPMKRLYFSDNEFERITMLVYYDQKLIIKYGLRVGFYFSRHDRDGEHIYYTYTIKTQEQLKALVNYILLNNQNSIQTIFNTFYNYENSSQKKWKLKINKLGFYIRSFLFPKKWISEHMN